MAFGIIFTINDKRFYRPAWQVLDKDVRIKQEVRKHMMPTRKGWFITALPKQPRMLTIKVRYLPAERPNQATGGQVTPVGTWREDYRDLEIYPGPDSLWELLGEVVTLTWGDIEYKDYFFYNIEEIHSKMHPNRTRDSGSDVPQFIEYVLTFMENAPPPPPEEDDMGVTNING